MGTSEKNSSQSLLYSSFCPLVLQHFPFQEERSSFLSREVDEDDDSRSRGLYSTTITKPVSNISPSSTLTKKQQPASFLLSDVVTRGSSSLPFRY